MDLEREIWLIRLDLEEIEGVLGNVLLDDVSHKLEMGRKLSPQQAIAASKIIELLNRACNEAAHRRSCRRTNRAVALLSGKDDVEPAPADDEIIAKSLNQKLVINADDEVVRQFLEAAKK